MGIKRVSQGLDQLNLQCFQGWRSHSLSGTLLQYLISFALNIGLDSWLFMVTAKTLLISFWQFLMTYSLLTTYDDRFLPGNSAPQQKHSSHRWDHHRFQITGEAPGTYDSLYDRVLHQEVSLGRGLSCAMVVVPASASYCIVVHHHPHFTHLSGDPGPPCPHVVTTGAFLWAPCTLRQL